MFIAKKYLVLLLVSLISWIYIACSSQSQVNPLIGTWKYSVLGAPDQGKLSFTADGKVYSFLPNDNVIEGKYSFSEKEISIDYDVKITLTKTSATPEIPDPSKVSRLENRGLQIMQSEAKQYISTMNRSQQAFYLEKQKFATKLEELETGMPPETEKYKYAIKATQQEAIATAGAKKTEIKSYAGRWAYLGRARKKSF